MFRKLLVALDGSTLSLKAAQVAAQIACRFDSQVTLLHVTHLPSATVAAAAMAGMMGANEVLTQALQDTGQEMLCAIRQKVGLSEEQAGTEIRQGHCAGEICRLAEKGRYDLIVMGSRGLGEIGAFFLGSVSDRVSHRARCPVLIVR